MISVYRYINDISLNGKEYLLDEENKELKFDNKEQAFNFLSDGGIKAKDEEELEDFAKSINKNKRPTISLKDGAYALKVAHQIIARINQ